MKTLRIGIATLEQSRDILLRRFLSVISIRSGGSRRFHSITG